MSAFNGKRKKYSWLPEANPSALSGDTSPATSTPTTKSDKSEKTPRTNRPKPKGSGRSKQKDKDKDSERDTEAAKPEFIVDSLGITTSAPPSGAAADAAESIAFPAASSASSGSGGMATPVDAGTSRSFGGQAMSQQSNIGSSVQSVTSKIRRRPRKDSVDELVRSRFMQSMSAQQTQTQSQQQQQQQRQGVNTPPAKGARTANGGTPRSRKKGGDISNASITASVRDALASERTGSVHASPSVLGGSAAPLSSSAPLSVLGNKHRGGHHHHSSLQSGNGVSGTSTPTNAYASAANAPSPQLGRLESKYSFPTYTSFNPRNVTSTLKRGDHGVGPADQARGLDVTTGENVIVINPGSRWLRIGRASDAVPRELPHAIARRLRVPSQNSVPASVDPGTAESSDTSVVPENESDRSSGNNSSGSGKQDESEDHAANPGTEKDKGSEPSSSGSMEANSPANETASESGDNGHIDIEDSKGEEPSAGIDPVDSTLEMLREALKQHQRQSKRKAPPNAYAQVLTYNNQSKPEVIQDHNDPFKIEWLPSSEIHEDFVIGEKALRIADPEKFVIRYPIRNGCFNVEDYASIEEVLGDIEAIWTSVLETELGIKRKGLSSYGAVLAIPDIYSRVEVTALSEMLLRRMGFHSLLIQQSSTLVTFGAGFSTACVVDVGAQKTSIACVEDGYCHQESRVNIMYGGDDITRFLSSLFMRSAFPYHEASLQRMYDWSMLNELRERYCTMNLSDVNIRMHDFFVRSPNDHTYKYSFKTYDEMYQAPLCLFYPTIADAYYKPPDYAKTFVNASYPEAYGEAKSLSCSHLTITQFGILPSKAVESEAVPEAAQITEAATAPATVPGSAPGTPDPHANPSAPATPMGKAISSSMKAMLAEDGSKTSPSTPSVPNVAYVPDPEAQYSRMPLDAAITHSISHAGSVDRAKKLYVSIVLVGGGVSFIPGFDDVLASRLMYIRPEYMQGVERADIVSPPRDLDPRVLAWKGGAVLSRLECSKEMWITAQEWADFGSRLLRDRLLFQW